MGTPTPKDPTYDPFIEAARKRILDGKRLFDELSSLVHDEWIQEEAWEIQSTELQKFWIDLAASVRASESIIMKGQLTRATIERLAERFNVHGKRTLLLETEDGNGEPAQSAVILEPNL